MSKDNTLQPKRYRLLRDLPGEIWKLAYKWELGYWVSTKGRLRTVGREFLKKDGKNNHYSPKIPSQHINGRGYWSATLCCRGRKRTTVVHILMLKTFIDPHYVEKGLVGNHKDGNKLNNDLDNLEIVTYSENITHAYKMKLRKTA